MARLFEDIVDNQNINDDERSSSSIVCPEEPIWTRKKTGAQIYEYDLTIILCFELRPKSKRVEAIAEALHDLLESSRCIDDISPICIDDYDLFTVCVNLSETARIEDFVSLLCKINNMFYSQSSASGNYLKLIRPKEDLTADVTILNLHFSATGGVSLNDLVFYAKMSDEVQMEEGSTCAYIASKIATSFYGHSREKQMGAIRYVLDALEKVNENKLRGYEEVKAKYAPDI